MAFQFGIWFYCLNVSLVLVKKNNILCVCYASLFMSLFLGECEALKYEKESL